MISRIIRTSITIGSILPLSEKFLVRKIVQVWERHA